MIEAAAFLIPKLHELNGNKTIKFKEKYPALKTRKQSAETWWNSLSFLQKVEVGSVAIHCHRMTPNYKWKCRGENMFQDLTTSQKKLVKFVFAKKNDNWFMFDLAGMLKVY